MKNTEIYYLEKCILMNLEEYDNLINNITGGLKTVNYDDHYLYYEDTEKAEKSETFWNKDINETLSDYFDVKVTSVHADNSDVVGIWICYKE